MKKKILVIRFKQIGDAILSSVICKSLKETYPNSEIDYVLYDYVAPLFENQPYIDNIYTLNKDERKYPWKYFKKVWEITRKDYHIIIDIMSTPKSELFTLLSPKSKYKIGREKKYRGYTYTDKISEPNDSMEKPNKFLQMLKPLERDGENIIYNPNYSLTFKDNQLEKMQNKLIEAGVNLKKPIIIFSVTSRRDYKIYPIKNMKKIIKNILDKYNCQGIFYYSPEEKEFVKKIHKELNNDPRIFSNIKTESIVELGCLIYHCDMFIGNEGGPRHLAEAVDTPSFGIFNPRGKKRNWISLTKERHQGIDLLDLNLSGIDISKLTHEEKYELITPDIILDKVYRMINKFINKGEFYE